MGGNQMKMREALEKIAAIPMPPPNEQAQSVAVEMRELAIAALAEPPRNCDLARYWLQDLYCNFKPPATVRREMPPEWVDAVMAFCKWLLAPAVERKGETDGNE